jgi:hypothetical protein
MSSRFVLAASIGLAILLTYPTFSSIVSSFPVVLSFAQEEMDPVTEDLSRLNGAGEEQPRIEALDSGAPMIQNVSERGIFVVQLQWPEIPLNPQGAFLVEAIFLDASAPPPSPDTVPQARTNISGQSPEDLGRFVFPEALEPRVPVSSYDMAIISEDGRELWREVNRPGTGGAATERVILEEEYYGPVTIVIDNIVPGWEVNATDLADPIVPVPGEQITDSVSFNVRIVPEFPLFAILPLVIGVSIVIMVMRTRTIGIGRRF